MKKRYGYYAVKRSDMEFIVVDAENAYEADLRARGAKQHFFLIPKDLKEALDERKPGAKFWRDDNG